VTFADPAVKKLLQKEFVCAWVNLEGEAIAGSSFAHEPGTPAGQCVRGNGEHNIQLLTMTPEGKVFHVLAGYVAPRELVEELRLALSIFGSLDDEVRTSPEDRVVAAHKDFLAEHDKRASDAPEGLETLLDMQHSRVRQDHRFCMRRPLMDVADFRPEMLVGNATTFFGSSTGGKPGETIGQGGQEALDRIRKLIEENDG
jgi:hypothetical protein